MGGNYNLMAKGFALEFKEPSYNEKLAMQSTIYPELLKKDGFISKASGPKIRKLKKWSKQTKYGGEV